MTRLVGAVLARNEAAPDRYLRLVLNNLQTYCDSIVVVDDGSTDHTASICAEVGSCRVISRPSKGFWGSDEVGPRSTLWKVAATLAGLDGWIYVADADHELVGITPSDLRTCLRSTHVNAWSLPLWDCWDSPDQMRVDGFWQAHLHPRPWFFRAQPTSTWKPDWSTIDRKGVHCGHFPPNYPLVCGVLPGAAIRHHGYIQASHRKIKHAKYLGLVQNASLVTL